MYISITNFNWKNKEDIENALKSIVVEFKQYNSSLEEFFDEEADYRLEMYLDSIDEDEYPTETLELIKSQEAMKDIYNLIAERYLGDEYIFDYDRMDNTVYHCINEYISNISKDK